MTKISLRFRRWLFYHQYKKVLKNDLPDANKEVTLGKGSLMHVEVYDVLDNKQMNRLIRRIASLDNKKFDVDLIYKKSRLKTRNYIRPQFDHRSTAILATIKQKNDNFMPEIGISWTQINNDEAVIEYRFSFGKVISSIDDCKSKVLDYWDLIMAVESLPFYKSVDDFRSHDDENDEHIYRMFLTIFQGFVNKHLYTNLGHKYQLPINVLQLSKTSRHINELLRNEHLFARIYKKSRKKIYIIHSPIDEWMIRTLVIGKSYSREGLLGYFSEYGMNYYYYIFGKIEVSELSSKLTNYLNSGKTKLSLKNRRWLFRKFRRVSEVKLFPRESWEIKDITGVSKDVQGLKYGGNDLAKRFKAVYEDNLKYANSVFNLMDVHVWVWVVFTISLLGLLATIFQFFFPSIDDLVEYLSRK